MAAAIAKSRGEVRNRRLYFPWGLTDDAFNEQLKKYEPKLGADMSAVIARVREKHRHELPHVEAIKQISNTEKHWELLAATGSARAVALNIADGQRIFQIPADAFRESDEYEFHRASEKLPRVPLQIVIGVEVEGLGDGLPKSPGMILNCAFRFVAGVIEAIEA